ncbi:MAG: Omp28-related outer membrane protein, partial [Saprospiraceae bacterium]
MKNLFIAFAFLFVSISVEAQSQKIPLIEHFTNTKCSVCKNKNPKFYTLFAPYQSKIHHVSIHPSVPYVDCALYQANIPDNGARQDYYQIFGTPVGYMNGMEASNGTNIFTQTELDQSLLESSPIEMKVVENTGINRSVSVEIKTTGNPPAGNYKLHLMAVENELNYNSPNGETLHHDVLRKMIPDFNGTDISLQSAGFNQILNFNYSIPAAWVESQMYVIAFVQNQDT